MGLEEAKEDSKGAPGQPWHVLEPNRACTCRIFFVRPRGELEAADRENMETQQPPSLAESVTRSAARDQLTVDAVLQW